MSAKTACIATMRLVNIIQTMWKATTYALTMRTIRMTNEEILKSDYSMVFDRIRQNMVVQSHYKYGRAGRNFTTGNVDAIGSLKKCLAKFEETGNTEYLADVANYAMFRYMYPQNGECYRATDSDGSAGIVGMSVNEMESYKNDI